MADETERATPETEEAFDPAAYVLADTDVTKEAVPTYHVQLSEKFIALTKLEDEAPHLNGKAGFGKLARDQQEAVLPLIPADEAENVRKHWELWDKFFYTTANDNGGKTGHGVMLCDGGKEGVDEFAAEYRRKYPNRKTRRKCGERGKKKRLGRPRKKQVDQGQEAEANEALTSKRRMIFAALDLDPEHFKDYTSEELQALSDSATTFDAQPFGMVLHNRLVAKGFEAEVGWAIVHNLDRYTIADFDAGLCTFEQVNTLKVIHIHILERAIDRDHGLSVAEVAEAWGVDTNFIRFPKDSNGLNLEKGRYAFENQAAYLPHAKQPDKVLYSFMQVARLCGPLYMNYAREHSADWAEFRARRLGTDIRAGKKTLEAIDLKYFRSFYDACRFGEIVRDDIEARGPDGTQRSNPLFRMYTSSPKTMSEIDAALKHGAAARSRNAMDAIRDPSSTLRKVNIFIYGRSGSGKGRLMNALYKGLISIFQWHGARLAAEHPFDSFTSKASPEVVLMNEVRSNVAKFQAMLAFTDPDDADELPARYRNAVGAYRVLVLTTSSEPVPFWYFMPGVGGGNRSDPLDQGLRRMSWVIEVRNPFEFGDYNCRIWRPRRIPPGETRIVRVPVTDEFGVDDVDEVELNEWSLELFPADMSIDDVLKLLLEDIDRNCNDGNLAKSGKLNSAIQELRLEYRRHIEPAVRAGALPPLPPLVSLFPPYRR